MVESCALSAGTGALGNAQSSKVLAAKGLQRRWAIVQAAGDRGPHAAVEDTACGGTPSFCARNWPASTTTLLDAASASCISITIPSPPSPAGAPMRRSTLLSASGSVVVAQRTGCRINMCWSC